MTPLAVAIRHPPVVWWGAIVYANRRMQGRDAELVPADRAARRRRRRGQRVPLSASPPRWPAPGAWTKLALVLDMFRSEGYPVLRIDDVDLSRCPSWPKLPRSSAIGRPSELVLAQAGRYPGHIANTGAHVIRPLDQALAQAALGVGDAAAAAAAHADRAVTASRRNRTPAFLARELVFLAEARRRLGASSGEVRPLVREALAVAEPLGARVVAVDVERYRLPS